MAKFNNLSQEPVAQRESHISDYWDEIDLLRRSVETRADQTAYNFYEGPPTANGKPGIHHVLARTLKDFTCRYKTMQGFKVARKAGWDTHGLPVEIEVEKRLGLKSKQEIEEYGIKEFNEKCRESVFEYEALWREMTRRMGFLVDMDDPYITLDNEYIESIWWILDNMFKDGYIYEGQKILPYCPRCGTGLASHEVAQGYEEVKTPTIIMKFKAKDEDAYYLAWTTTPWTVPSNVALTVHPEVEYIKASYSDGNIYYLAKDLAPAIFSEEYEVLESMKGRELEYREYEQILPMIETEGKGFYITLGDYVTTTDGTGIVHTAPAFGEDDYQIGRKYDLPFVKPVDDRGNYTDTIWKGKFVHEVNDEIIRYMKEQGLVFSKETIVHNYPHCWRCSTPLIYYAHPSWYIEVTKYKDKMVALNNEVNWFPQFVGEKRFGNWLENLNDWAISRSRYWGTPIPIWRCEDCGEVTTVGSRKELTERSIEDIDESIELHRPYIDDVHFKCSCGGKMTRIPDVIDVWFDSGSMPFAQWHYPFENKEIFEERFPADYINEGIDQTRGWFYSLLAISTYVTGKSPFKNVLVNDLILDKNGKKMSKSRGNTVNPGDLFDEFGADAVRWYLMHTSPPWSPTKFDVEGLREINSKFFRSLRNIHSFFTLYANIHGIDPRDFSESDVELEEIDYWILSKYNQLVKRTNDNFDIFEITAAVRDIQNFVVEDMSNWYIRRNRKRFWEDASSSSQNAVFKTTYDILLGISKLIAPVAPFIAEEIYGTLVEGESVHIEQYPKPNLALINPELEEKMDLVRTFVTLGRGSREAAKIKVRQPLQRALIDQKYESIMGDLSWLIQEELNVKEVNFEKDLSGYINYSLKPNFRTVGAKLGPKVKPFSKALTQVDAAAFIQELEEKGSTSLSLDGENLVVTQEDVLISVSAKEGYDVEVENNVFILLDTRLTEELEDEGFAREFISKVQQMRKSSGFEVLDHIEIIYSTDERATKGIEAYREMIMDETLTREMISDENRGEVVDLNGHPAYISLKKVAE